jgi:hypothetical protein
MFVGEPPTNAASDVISGKGAPMSFAYRSIDDRPMWRVSYCN